MAGRTRHGQRTGAKRVGILLENHYEDQEFWYPFFRLQEGGIRVDVIAPVKGGIYTSKHGYPATSTIAAKDVRAGALDGLIIPGGYAPDHMRRTPAMVNVVRNVYRAGGFLATICHGGWMLCSVPETIRGRTVTGFFAIKDDLGNAGARFVDRDVVEDGPVISSRKPADLPAFMRTVLKRLE